MNDDEFQKRLQNQPRRPIPAAWRSSILAAAKDAATEARANRPRIEWLWPCPQAWAGLAAAWVVIAVLHFQSAARPLSAEEAQNRTAPPRMGTLAERQRELGEALDLLPPPSITEKKKHPGPRGNTTPACRNV